MRIHRGILSLGTNLHAYLPWYPFPGAIYIGLKILLANMPARRKPDHELGAAKKSTADADEEKSTPELTRPPASKRLPTKRTMDIPQRVEKMDARKKFDHELGSVIADYTRSAHALPSGRALATS